MARKKKDYSLIFVACASLALIIAYFIFGPGSGSLSEKRKTNLEKARYLMANGDLPGTEAVLQSALEKDPENPDVYMMMGDLLMAKGHLQGAIFYFEQAKTLKPYDRECVIKLLLPLFLIGESSRGIELLQDIVNKDPMNPMNYLDIANMKTELASSLRAGNKPWQQELEKGQKYLEQALRLDSNLRGADLVRGKLALLAGNQEDGRIYFEKELSRTDLVDPALKIDLAAAAGLLAFQSGEESAAKDYFDKAEKMFSEWKNVDYQRTLHNRELFLLVGEVFFGEILTAKKLKSFYPEYDDLLKKGIFPQLKYDQARGLFLAILDAREQKQWDKAVDLAIRLNRDFGDPAQPQCFFHNYFFRPLFKTVTYILLGDLQLKAGKSGEAKKSYLRALEFSPGNPAVKDRLYRLR